MEPQVSTVLEIQRLRTRREIIVDINFNTDRLVVLNYPVGAGGKFISLALGLHQNILIQEQTMARLMMKNRVDPTMRFKLAMKTFEKTEETNSHFEFGCSQLSGFNSGMLDQDKTADEKACNDLWRELTNQDKFYFFMVDNSNKNPYSRYTHRKNIRLINYDWIMQDRGIDQQDTLDIEGESITFNMESIKENTSFVDEVYKIFKFLGLVAETDHPEQLNQLRERFIQTFKTGFNKGGN